MSIAQQIRAKASMDPKIIVFPEGEEPRTIHAASILSAGKIVQPVLLGEEERILAFAGSEQIDLTGVRILDPNKSCRRETYASALAELRKAKGMTLEQALELVSDPMYYGVMMVQQSDADGLVSGAVHTTGDMLRPALQIIKTKPGIHVVSGCLLIELKNRRIGRNGLLLFSDCVVVPCPTAQELAQIAVSTARTARDLCDIPDPKTALLSFSTKGSAKHELVSKVQEAVQLAHEIAPDLILDGELQFDAAVIPEIGCSKAPGSPVAGHADVLIFPDLQSGNIGYKIAQRLGDAEAIAVLQGLAKPCNDLSRGCSVEDIVTTAAITAVQSMSSC